MMYLSKHDRADDLAKAEAPYHDALVAKRVRACPGCALLVAACRAACAALASPEGTRVLFNENELRAYDLLVDALAEQEGEA